MLGEGTERIRAGYSLSTTLIRHGTHLSRTPTGLPRSGRTSYDRGGCPPYPKDAGAHPELRYLLSRRLPPYRDQSLTPLQHPTFGAVRNEASTRVQAIHPSGLPLACGIPDGTGALRLTPSFAPRRPGAGRRTRGQGLNACDLASHGANHSPAALGETPFRSGTRLGGDRS